MQRYSHTEPTQTESLPPFVLIFMYSHIQVHPSPQTRFVDQARVYIQPRSVRAPTRSRAPRLWYCMLALSLFASKIRLEGLVAIRGVV
jgi:hypothetical protein